MSSPKGHRAAVTCNYCQHVRFYIHMIPPLSHSPSLKLFLNGMFASLPLSFLCVCRLTSCLPASVYIFYSEAMTAHLSSLGSQLVYWVIGMQLLSVWMPGIQTLVLPQNTSEPSLQPPVTFSAFVDIFHSCL